MRFSHSVHHRAADVSTLTPALRARVQIIRSDPFGTFARAAARQSPRRLTIVSPWVSDEGERLVTLAGLVEHAERHGAAVVLVTRPPTSEAHERALEIVRAASRGRVCLNRRLHAKLYVCESGEGRGVAVVGSANSTGASAFLDEVAVLLRPERGSTIIRELGGPTVRGLMDNRRASR